MSQHPAIEVVGARTHNLKGIDCRIPHARVTVVTGLSGAGKSSLVSSPSSTGWRARPPASCEGT